MPKRRKRFTRPLGERRYRRLFIIAVEGAKTEFQYFDIFNGVDAVIRVKCLKGRHDSAPPHVLKRMQEHLREERLKKGDEAWLVVDRDNWTEDQLRELHDWSTEDENRGLALSNPKFEYWLLLHFENGDGIASSNDCTERLKRYLFEYDKGIDVRTINLDMIERAIQRAKKRDTPRCPDWPRAVGSTTVYRLVENILREAAHK